MKARGRRPNILLITSDEQRTDTLRCYGNGHAVSPRLDRLASEGVVFDQAHTNCPVCMPARCSLLTGVHTPVHGCLENGFRRREDLPSYPDLLAASGYTCIVSGKTHFGTVPGGFSIRHAEGLEKSGTNRLYAAHLRRLGHRPPEGLAVEDHPVPPEHHADALITDGAMEGMREAMARGRSLVLPLFPVEPASAL